MKKQFLFIALIFSMILMSAGAISATDINSIDNATVATSMDIDTQAVSQDDMVSVSSNSNVYFINNTEGVNEISDSQRSQDFVSNINNVSSVDNENNASNKQGTHIDSSNIELYYKNGTRLEMGLFDENNNPLANMNVIISINSVDYTKTTDANGMASIAINLIPGTYAIKLTFEGTNQYQPSEKIVNVTVFPVISGNDISKYFRNGTQYYATFLDNHGNPLANTNVTFNINGVFYTKTTDDKGIARLNINLNPGTYILTAIHPINQYLWSNTVVVYSTINGSDITKVYKDSQQYSATFLDSQGKPLVNTNVTFNINGVFYTKTTDDKGIARLNINLLAGKYIITCYNPNDEYKFSNLITILAHSSTYIDVKNITAVKGMGNKIYATLYNKLNHTVPKQNIIISIDGNSYTLQTNDQGLVSLPIDLKANTYTVYYEYRGSSTYSSSGAKSTLVVLDGINVNYDVISDNIIYYMNNESFKVIIKDMDGNPISDINMTITINGVTYNKTTDNNGMVSLTIKLSPGVYPVSFNVNQEGYNSNVGNSTIYVVAGNQTTITGSNTTIIFGACEQFSVLLTAGSTPLVGEKVIFQINGINYTKITNSDGVANLTINLGPGKYDINYIYEGNSKLIGSTGKAVITVSSVFATKFTYGGKSDYNKDKGEKFAVTLKDTNDNPLVGYKVIFTIDGKQQEVITNNNGVASIIINQDVGTYKVDYQFKGSDSYSPCNGSSTIRVVSSISNANGYWLFGSDMKKIDLATLASKGTGNIFLNYYAISLYGESGVSDWIKEAAKYNIKVHIWMQSFFDGSFVSPVLSNGKPDYQLFDKKIDEAKSYAAIEGVAGIHLDYLRFPGNAYKHTGGTAAINEFVKLLTTAVKEVNPNILISAAVMPEKSSNAYYYGQDVTVLGNYLDIIIPMIYKGNYNAGTSWITSTTKWFVDNSQGAQVWSGLQTYRSDSDVSKLSVSELSTDAQAAINGGAAGTVMFRYGLANFIDFNSLNYPNFDPVIPPVGVSVSMNQIYQAAVSLKDYMEANGVLPTSIKIGNHDFTSAQILYMMSFYVANFGSQKECIVINVTAPTSPSGDIIYAQLVKSEYDKLANKIFADINEYGTAPAFESSSIGNIKYSTLVYSFSKIVRYMGLNNIAPSFVYVTNIVDNFTVTVTMMPSNTKDYQPNVRYTTTWKNYCPHCGYYGTLLINPKHTIEGELTCAYCDADYCGVSGNEKVNNPTYRLTRLTESIPESAGEPGNNVSLKDILSASVYLKGYIEANNDLPDSITLNDKQYTLPQFLYLMSKAIVNINNGNSGVITVIPVNNPSNPMGDIIDSSLNKADYLTVASNVAKFIENEEQAPNYASSTVGKIIYDELLDAFARILAYYDNNNQLPATVAIKHNQGVSTTIQELSKSLTDNLNTTREKANALFTYVRDKIAYEFYYNTVKGADGTLQSGGGNCCDQAQLLVAMCRAVGLTARFATGNCYFYSSQTTYGHVWVQILIDNQWVVADPTSTRNSLGIVRNWNTASYTDRGTYETLPY